MSRKYCAEANCDRKSFMLGSFEALDSIKQWYTPRLFKIILTDEKSGPRRKGGEEENVSSLAGTRPCPKALPGDHPVDGTRESRPPIPCPERYGSLPREGPRGRSHIHARGRARDCGGEFDYILNTCALRRRHSNLCVPHL